MLKSMATLPPLPVHPLATPRSLTRSCPSRIARENCDRPPCLPQVALVAGNPYVRFSWKEGSAPGRHGVSAYSLPSGPQPTWIPGAGREGPGPGGPPRAPGGRPSVRVQSGRGRRGRGPGGPAAPGGHRAPSTPGAPNRPGPASRCPGPRGFFSLYHKYINYANYGHCILTKPETSPARPPPPPCKPLPAPDPATYPSPSRLRPGCPEATPIRDSSHSPDQGTAAGAGADAARRQRSQNGLARLGSARPGSRSGPAAVPGPPARAGQRRRGLGGLSWAEGHGQEAGRESWVGGRSGIYIFCFPPFHGPPSFSFPPLSLLLLLGFF
jgi:hypothetical protein